MRPRVKRIGRYVFSALTALALGLGASQALAGPPQEPASSARLCDPIYCDEWCQSQGYMFGRCSSGMGRCICDPYPIEQ